DTHVDPPEFVEHAVDELLRRRRVGEVAVDPGDVALGAELVERSLVPVVVALGRVAEREPVVEQPVRNGETDAGVRAGDESDLHSDACSTTPFAGGRTPGDARRALRAAHPPRVPL